jgi:type IV secretory pathway protease TraF
MEVHVMPELRSVSSKNCSLGIERDELLLLTVNFAWSYESCSFALSPPKTVARELKEMSYYCLLWILHDLMNLAASLSVSSKNCSSGIERDELLMLAVNFAWSYESCSFALSPPILMIITTLVRIDLCI